jgi:hypothetical protein
MAQENPNVQNQLDLQTAGNAVSDAVSVARKIVPPQLYDALTLCGTLLCVVLFVCFPLRRTLVRITKKVGSLVVRVGKGVETPLYAAIKQLVQHENAQLEVHKDGTRILKSGLLAVFLNPNAGKPVLTVKLDNSDLWGVLTEKEYVALFSVVEKKAQLILKAEMQAKRDWQAFRAQEILRDVDNGLHGGTSKIGPIRRA